MRTGIAALDDSIAERGRFGKTAERDNEALKREKCNAYPYKTGVHDGDQRRGRVTRALLTPRQAQQTSPAT